MIKDLVIAGAAQSGYAPAQRHRRLEELIFETAAAALQDAGMTRRDIDSVSIAASDLVDGRCISSMLTANAAGSYLKDEIKTTDEGAFALIPAALRLMTGHFQASLVVSWSKPSESCYSLAQNLAAEPFYLRDAGLNHVTASALMASAYRHRFHPPEEASAQVVAKNRRLGLKNPLLTGVEALEPAQVLASPRVAYPLRRLEIAPEADGVAALVLARSDQASRSRHRPVYLRGMGWEAESYHLGARDLSRLGALHGAAQRTFRQADVDPGRDLQVAELCDATPYHELMAYEALGLCGPGEAADLLSSGATLPGGKVAVNPSGGCLSAYPVFSSGLTRVVEAYLQVSGRAGERQVTGAHTALAHGCAGFAGQSHAVFILSSQ